MGRVQNLNSKKSPRRKPAPLPVLPGLSSNTRSCLNCHKRKVRCDRKLPCTQCDRAGWTCVYPSTDRDKSKKAPPLEDVTSRLERIEAVLLRLSDCTSSFDFKSSQRSNEDILKPSINTPNPTSSHSRPWEVLLKDGNRVHYVDNANLLDLFHDDDRINPPELQSSHEDRPGPSSDLNLKIGLPATLLSTCPDSDLGRLHPEPRLALKLWTTYVENVDPVVKILHIPTTQSAMVAMISEPNRADPSLSALAFAVYFAAVTSLDDDQIATLSSENRQRLLHRFKTGLNQAIMDADLLNQPDVTVLQAVAIFATCLRVHDISRTVWILIGTAIRLAQSIGIHRDGASLKLSPFETELRLRLWWHLCLLDARAPEDHGFALTIESRDQGLRLPRNLDDDQLFPAMKTLPPDSDTWTEATFSLIQIQAFRLLHQVLGPKPTNEADARLDLIAKRKVLETHIAWMNSKYFVHYTSPGLQKTAYTHYRTACSKIDFMLLVREELQIHNQEASSTKFPRGLGRIPFLAAYHTLESSYSLTSGEVSANFSWLFRTYTQWYALAYVLRYLCAFPTAPEAEQAWNMVNRTFIKIPYSQSLSTSMPQTGAGRSSIWRCLELLRFQASNARANARGSSGSDALTDSTCARGSETEAGDVLRNREHGNKFASSNTPAHQVPGQHISQPITLAAEISHPLDQTQERHDSWQNGFFTFTDSVIPEMLYLPEWSDIVNISSGISE